ncbi:MAG: thioredoxin domain-containing protein [Kiritimatiellae bacterium]|nr:thioredoxin domain-containing protein [Kiritimatiellia bacterium]
MKKRIGWLFGLVVVSMALNAVAQEAAAPLSFGDAMPEVQGVVWWKGSDPMAAEEDARPDFVVYDCWATWCGPCIQSIPHLNELAEKYAGRIAFAGIAVWDEQDNVKKFLDKRGGDMNYAVGFDTDGEVAEKIMKAAGQDGIPCAFVVDAATKKLLWYGHPMTMDGVLKSMVSGTYDPAEALAALQAEKAIQSMMAEGKWDEAQQLVDEWTGQEPDKAAVFSLWIQVQKKDVEGAQRALDAILQSEVKPTEAMNVMGLMVLALDRFPDSAELQQTAVAGAEKIAAANEDDLMLQGMYWYALNAAERYDEASRVADRMLELAWNDPEKLNELAEGMLLDEVGAQYYAQADRAVKRVRELLGDAAGFNMAEFKLAALRGEDENVQSAVDRLLALEDADPELINTAAWELLTNRRVEKDYTAPALLLAEKAEALTMGENPAILDTLALAMFKKGQIERAIEIEKNAIVLAPQYDFLKMQLAMFEDALGTNEPDAVPPEEAVDVEEETVQLEEAVQVEEAVEVEEEAVQVEEEAVEVEREMEEIEADTVETEQEETGSEQ